MGKCLIGALLVAFAGQTFAASLSNYQSRQKTQRQSIQNVVKKSSKKFAGLAKRSKLMKGFSLSIPSVQRNQGFKFKIADIAQDGKYSQSLTVPSIHPLWQTRYEFSSDYYTNKLEMKVYQNQKGVLRVKVPTRPVANPKMVPLNIRSKK